MHKWSLAGAKRAIVVGGCLAMAYTQVTTSPILVDYARRLGADGFHIGILGAAPTGLFFVQFVAGALVNHVRYRRWWWFGSTLLHRLSYVPVAVGPWVFPDWPDSTWVSILVVSTLVNHALLHFGSPLWLSWMGDYLPTRGISQFWGVRHLWQQWAAAGTLLIGASLFTLGGDTAQAAFSGLLLASAVIGVADILLFLKVEEPPVRRAENPAVLAVLAAPFRCRQFRSFIRYACFWHFAAMVGAPFISMYLLQHIGMSLDRVLLLWALSFAGGAALTRQFGWLAERYGHRPLLIACTALKALNMAALLVVPRDPVWAFWILMPVLMTDAQLNAGLNIANQGFLLKYSPSENRTMFLAAGTALAGLIGGLTAALTGWILTRLGDWQYLWRGHAVIGFHVVFTASLLLRVAAIALARSVHEPQAETTRTMLRQLARALSARIAWRRPRQSLDLVVAPVLAESLADGVLADESLSDAGLTDASRPPDDLDDSNGSDESDESDNSDDSDAPVILPFPRRGERERQRYAA